MKVLAFYVYVLALLLPIMCVKKRKKKTLGMKEVMVGKISSREIPGLSYNGSRSSLCPTAGNKYQSKAFLLLSCLTLDHRRGQEEFT